MEVTGSSSEQNKRLESAPKGSACLACRRQKIKCHMRNSQPPCNRCKKRGLKCMVNRSIQTLLEHDEVWKQETEQRLARLENVLATDSRSTNRNVSSASPVSTAHGPGEHQHQSVHSRRQDTTEEEPASGEAIISMLEVSRPDSSVIVDLETSPGTMPGHHFPSQASVGSNMSSDVIARGVVTVENAGRYCSAYVNLLDHFLYGIVANHSNGATGLVDLRKTSRVLFTAICTVGSLYLAAPDFEVLYKEFVAVSAGLSLTKQGSLDDIRALCIGAFWLEELSTSLVGVAVRLAAELQLYRSLSKALEGDRDHYIRMRLYFLVYVCDHHFSIPYGRAPMTRESQAIRNARNLLRSEHATEDDSRLVSQVLRWSACSNIYDTLGDNVDGELSHADIQDMRKFNMALDNLRIEWEDRFKTNTYVGNYPQKGASLQYHFAKLYLGSHAFRSLKSNLSGDKLPDGSLDIEELAHTAIFSATSILRTVISDTEMQSYLHGMPTYFHTMITFATVFLLKVSTRFSPTCRQLDMQEVRSMLVALINILKRVTNTMHPRHHLVNITKGINEVLRKAGIIENPALDSISLMPTGMEETVLTNDMTHADFSFLDDEMFDQTLIGGYDLLSSQQQYF